jgi:multicomponent Na+:H+ antiporter subunit E
VRRAESTLYIHALDTVDPDKLRRAEQDVLDSEERVLRAFGSDEEIAALDAEAARPTDRRAGVGRR